MIACTIASSSTSQRHWQVLGIYYFDQYHSIILTENTNLLYSLFCQPRFGHSPSDFDLGRSVLRSTCKLLCLPETSSEEWSNRALWIVLASCGSMIDSTIQASLHWITSSIEHDERLPYSNTESVKVISDPCIEIVNFPCHQACTLRIQVYWQDRYWAENFISISRPVGAFLDGCDHSLMWLKLNTSLSRDLVR